MANNMFDSLLGGPGQSFSDNVQNSIIGDIDKKVIPARVIDISLNSNSTMWDEVGEWSGIGTIKFQLMDTPTSVINSTQNKTSNIAKPLLPGTKTYPLVNEIVLLFRLPNTQQSQTSSTVSYYYLSAISLWNAPNHNAYPDMYSVENNGVSAPSFLKDYIQIALGNSRKTTDEVKKIDLNGASGGTFEEKSNVHPILPFAGDNILEGRFGNSIRLGNTSKTSGKIKNNWSNSGENGDPISIIRNGQPNGVAPGTEAVSDEGWIPITENIKNDLASIYLTSTQQIPIEVATGNKGTVFSRFLAEPVPFSNTIKNIPISPRSFNAPQIILNSSRLLFNTNTDSILMSAYKSIVLESNEDLAIKSKQKNVNILATQGVVSLGKQNATEAVILGDKFLLQFDNLIESLENLCKALKNEPKIPAAASVADLTIPILQDIKNLIPTFKSQKVKTS
tara:strand:+ start:543 stop:1889 length:1347 start_codon:yes stop_codon:yes gene_type:complete